MWEGDRGVMGVGWGWGTGQNQPPRQSIKFWQPGSSPLEEPDSQPDS